ncbi:hypothetical protein ACFVP8_16720 [Viridibacillus arvi]|uniref:hypothetical protein n=1 Tax=Viridibacillus arvi TaxID=263475 RepID=UPI0036CF9987
MGNTMCIYLKSMIEKMDDTYENEFSIPILTEIIPFQISECSELDCRGQIKKLLSQDYKILIQTPNLPKRKLLSHLHIQARNNYFTLYNVSASSYTDDIWELLNDRQYANGHTFFFMKDTEEIEFELPQSSTKRLKVIKVKNNEIIILRLELGEGIRLTFRE